MNQEPNENKYVDTQLRCPHCRFATVLRQSALKDADALTSENALLFVICMGCAYILVLDKDTLRRPTAQEWDAVLTKPEVFRNLKEQQQMIELFIHDAGPDHPVN